MVFTKVGGRSKGDTPDAVRDGDERDLPRLPLRGEDGIKVGVVVGEECLGYCADIVDVHEPSTAYCKGQIQIQSQSGLVGSAKHTRKLTAGHNPDQYPKITRAQ